MGNYIALQQVHDNLVTEWETAHTEFSKNPTSEAVERIEVAGKALQTFMRILGLLP